LIAAAFRGPTLVRPPATLRLRRRGLFVIVDDVVIEIVEPIRNRRLAADMLIAGRFIFVATGGPIAARAIARRTIACGTISGRSSSGRAAFVAPTAALALARSPAPLRMAAALRPVAAARPVATL
jgi:hypothetical protein